MRRLPLILAAAATGCYSIVGTEFTVPPDAVRNSDPPALYRTWYEQTEECVGVDGDFRSVRWFTVPGERWWDPVFEQYAIGTWRPQHDIYIAHLHLGNPSVVKHEIVHDLLHGGASDDRRFVECSGIGH
jgi:hypothetical protein